MRDFRILSVACGVLINWVLLEMTSRKSFRVARHVWFDCGYLFMYRSTEPESHKKEEEYTVIHQL